MQLHALPLPGLVALDTPRLALMLLAVEPRLRGAVFAGPAGSGKSALLRGLRELLPDDPYAELPAGSDEEALLGGLDVEATLRRGARVLRSGLLARAHGGTLLVEACNLLPEGTANLLLGALAEGEVRLERDGLSTRVPTRFRFLGSFDPAEGAPRAHLLDRVALIVVMPQLGQAAARAEIVRRHFVPTTELWADELDTLRGLVGIAREHLAEVTLADRQREELITTAVSLGVQGHRADLFATLTARASAALALRDHVEREDLELAIRLVLLPRATRKPAPPEETQPQQQPSPAPSNETEQPDDGLPHEEELELDDAVLDALSAELPAILDALPFAAARRGRSGSRGQTEGKRGRHVASVPGGVRDGRVDVIATLRAAARWQRLRPRSQRRVVLRAEDLRLKRYRSKAGALFLFAVDASGSMALNRMRQAKGAVHALLEQAYVNRDRVALLSFRGRTSELLLPPTNSVELLRRAVDQLPTGGGTPLAATLVHAMEMAAQARRRGFANVVLVLLTDARANVGVRAERAGVDEELRQLALGCAQTGLRSLVIDTQRNFLSQGSAQRLAQWLGGNYLYLPGANGRAIASAARDAAL